MEDVVRRLAGVDLNLLVSLHALLQFRSVTGAANHVGVTQSTMSHQLARLRDLLGDPVLIRRGNEMEPTPRVVAIGASLGRALKVLHDAVLETPEFDPGAAEGEIVVALTDWSATEYAPRLTALFASEAPGLRLRVVPPLLDATVAGLDWSVDVAVLSTTEPLPEDRALPLLYERFTGVARADHPFCAEPPTAEAFHAAGKLVVHSAIVPSTLDDELERILRLDARAEMRVPFFLTLPRLLPQGDLVAVVPAQVAWGLVVDHGLGAFALPVELPRYHVSLAWSPLRAADPKIAWLARGVGRFVAEELPKRAARLRLP